MRPYRIFWCLLLVLSPVVGDGLELPYDEIEFQGHRCLWATSGGLTDDSPVVLVLHGSLGNAEQSFGDFYRADLPSALWVFPNGPQNVRKPGVPQTVHAWYGRFTHSYEDMKRSRKYLFDLLDHFSRIPSGDRDKGPLRDPRPVIVIGESQGAMMAFETGLNYPGKVLGIAALCGFIEYPDKTLAHPSAAKGIGILMLNGKMDPVVQEEDALTTLRKLKAKGYHASMKEFEVGHRITSGMKDATNAFLEGLLALNNGRDPF